jgi:TetR/AcrR family mexXY operon transcriptional repressor
MLRVVASSAITKRRAVDSSATRQRVLDATEAVILSGGFAQATVAELADKAGVSRATVFSRFGSKLGILEALALRCSGGPEMRAIRAALAQEDADRLIPQLVEASCEQWERQGHILLTLKAVEELDADASALVDDQRHDQRQGMEHVVRTMERAGRLGELTRQQAAAALHLVTSVESFMELRRNAGLSLPATKRVLTKTALGLFDPPDA